MFILKHGSKEAKPFLKSVAIGTTGLDVSFSEESKAMKFVSRGAAITIFKICSDWNNWSRCLFF
nr:MAG TPA: hypothetical protein [Caudoviricetes sp.]